jgi:hypothetical protein
VPLACQYTRAADKFVFWAKVLGSLHKIGLTLAELARWISPVVRGWMQYYEAFYRFELHPLLSRINAYLIRWIRKRYKRLRTSPQGRGLLAPHHQPALPALRPLGTRAWFPVGQDDESPVTRDLSRRDLREPESAIPSGHPTAATTAWRVSTRVHCCVGRKQLDRRHRLFPADRRVLCGLARHDFGAPGPSVNAGRDHRRKD